MNFVPYLMQMLAVEHTRKNTVGHGGKKPSEEHLVFEKPRLILSRVLSIQTIGDKGVV
jgi:hypothetical protein